MTAAFDEWPVGEFPDVTIAQAHQALDDVFTELADLKAENLLLKAELARRDRQGRGW